MKPKRGTVWRKKGDKEEEGKGFLGEVQIRTKYNDIGVEMP